MGSIYFFIVIYVNNRRDESTATQSHICSVKEVLKCGHWNKLGSFFFLQIHDCLEHQSSPIDGYTLTEALHHSGINMRYLGKVTEMIKKYPQLHYLHVS